MQAINNNNYNFAKWLLENGANPNAQMNTGWTAMHTAAKLAKPDLLKLLIDFGGQVDLLARHRDFGKNLKVADVTNDEAILGIIPSCA